MRTARTKVATSRAAQTLPLALLMLLSVLALASCNTFEGMGEDLQSAGQAVESEAEEERR